MNRILGILISSLFVLAFLCVSIISAGEPFAPLHKFTEKDFLPTRTRRSSHTTRRNFRGGMRNRSGSPIILPCQGRWRVAPGI
jgi:hypothetical protein